MNMTQEEERGDRSTISKQCHLWLGCINRKKSCTRDCRKYWAWQSSNLDQQANPNKSRKNGWPVNELQRRIPTDQGNERGVYGADAIRSLFVTRWKTRPVLFSKPWLATAKNAANVFAVVAKRISQITDLPSAKRSRHITRTPTKPKKSLTQNSSLPVNCNMAVLTLIKRGFVMMSERDKSPGAWKRKSSKVDH